MDYTAQVSEQMYPLTGIHAISKTAATYNGTWVSLQNYHRAFVFLDVGVMAGTSTIDLAIQQAQDTSGTGAKALSPAKAITQLTQASGDGNQYVCLEIRTEELDVTNGFDCIRFVLTVGAAASLVSVTLFGVVSRFEPVPTTNWAEIVT